LAAAAAADPTVLRYLPVPGEDMAPLKPPGFASTDWPSVAELLTFRSNGIVTYRDDFVYATNAAALAARIQRWLRLPALQAAAEFRETRDRKSGPALKIPFDPRSIDTVSYRPLDLRYLYNRREYVDFPKRLLQDTWGEDNIALFAVEDGTGVGPAVWCHGKKPDQHAFKGSYGGWVFPLRNHTPESRGHFFAPNVIGGLSAAYGRAVAPIEAFDAILALLSASSYTTRFAFDLEDEFPHVPFPADPAAFAEAAQIGSRIRALEGFSAPPSPEFCAARLVGRASGPVLDLPPPSLTFTSAGATGAVALRRDQSLRIVDVPERVWRFQVSGYSVLYRWLRARNGEAITGASGANLLRAALDIVWRIAELLFQFDRADEVLCRALDAPLTRADLDLPSGAEVALADDDDSTPG